MKKILFLICFSAILGFSSNAQNPEDLISDPNLKVGDVHFKLLDSVLTYNSSGEQAGASALINSYRNGYLVGRYEIIGVLIYNSTHYTRDGDNYVTSRIDSSMSTFAPTQPVSIIKTDYTYDANYRISHIKQQYGDSITPLYDSINYYYDYGTGYYPTTIITSLLKEGVFDTTQYTEYSYNSNGQLTQVNSHKVDDSMNLANDSLETYEYNADGQLLKYQSKLWDAVDSNYIMLKKNTYSYNGNGLETSNTSESYSADTLSYGTKYVSAYDSNGNLKSKLRQNWKSGAWVDNSYAVYSYDVNNFIDSITEYETSEATVALRARKFTTDATGKVLSRIDYKHNSDTTALDSVGTASFEYDTDGDLIRRNVSDFGGQDGFYIRYYYSIYTGISELEKATFKLYPNPSSEYFIIQSNDIEGKDLQILDINGRVVKQNTIQANSYTVTVNELQNGIYFVKIGNQVKKFVKN